jgi:hypothetical protein
MRVIQGISKCVVSMARFQMWDVWRTLCMRGAHPLSMNMEAVKTRSPGDVMDNGAQRGGKSASASLKFKEQIQTS